MLKKLFKTLLHICWYSVAAFIITFSVAVTLLRVMLPDLGEYREDVEGIISEYSGYPVQIQEINANWQGWIPSLKLDDIKILDPETEEILLSFENTDLEIDPIESLKHRTLIPLELRISGLELDFTRHEDGSIIIVDSGTSLYRRGMGEMNTELTNWLRNQKRITIENANLTWIDLTGQIDPIKFHNARLELGASEDEFRLHGMAASRQDETDAIINFDIDIYGDILSSDWSGTINLNSNNLDLNYLVKQIVPEDVVIQHEAANISIKSRFSYAKLNQLAATISMDAIDVSQDVKKLGYKQLDLELDLLRRNDDDWVIDIELADLETNHGLWQTPTARIELEQNDSSEKSTITSTVNQISVADLKDILSLIPVSPAADYIHLVKDGELENIRIILNDYKHKPVRLGLEGEFHDLELTYNNKFSVSNLQGVLKHNDQIGQLQIDSQNIEILAPDYYKDKKQLSNVEGIVSWRIEDDLILLETSDFDIKSEEFQLAVNGTMNLDEQALIDLHITTGNASLADIPDWLPIASRKKLSDWMFNAFKSGTIVSAETVLKGDLRNWSLDDKENTIARTTARIEDADLLYKRGWPLAQNLTGNVQIDGKKITAYTEQGNIYNANLKKITAVIPDVTSKKPILNVDGYVSGSCSDLINFIENSPLNKNTALQTPGKINLAGPMNLAYKLGIPLKKGSQTSVNGHIELLDNSINSERTGIQLEHLKGRVDFTRSGINANDLSAEYFNQPLTLNITRTDGKHIAHLSGEMDRKFIKKQFNHYYPSNTDLINDYLDQISGRSSWQASINLFSGEDSSQELLVTSDLVGIEIDLPQPLNKEKLQRLPITLKKTLNSAQARELEIQFGELLSARLGFTSGENIKLDSMNINFGGANQVSRQSENMHLGGHMESLQLSKWLKMIQRKSKQGIEKSTSIYDDLVVDITISELELFHQFFNQVNLKVDKLENDWHINVDSDDIRGVISIPSDTQSIVLNMDKLVLHKESRDESFEIDPLSLPSIHAYIQDFRFDNKQLGEMYLETSYIDNGLSFDNITFQKEGLEVTGHGDWIKVADKSRSSFNIDLEALKLNTMLETFEYTSTSIQEGKTDINIVASWDGAPMDFKLENLDGDMELIIDKGQILNINPKAGRLFGLLSLQSLPRRLSLDFSDLFGEGLSFDRIDGSFSLEQGNAYTNNLLMSGPSAKIAITGRTGLVEKDYDQLVTITPQIADTLPVASSLFGPVGVGVGAVIYFVGELFESIPSNIDKILQYQYTITGSWENPVVEQYQKEIQTSDNNQG